MMFERHELEMPQLQRLREHLSAQREKLRTALERTLPEIETATIRGEIAGIIKLQALIAIKDAPALTGE